VVNTKPGRFLLLLVLQSFNWLAAFHLELLQAILFIGVYLSAPVFLPAVLSPVKRPGTDCTWGWMCPSAGLDVYGKSRPLRDIIPETSIFTDIYCHKAAIRLMPCFPLLLHPFITSPPLKVSVHLVHSSGHCSSLNSPEIWVATTMLMQMPVSCNNDSM